MILWLAMEQLALCLLPIHDPLVNQGLASLQEHASTRMPGSLPALDVEAANQRSVEAFRFSASSGRTWGNIAHLWCLSSWMLCIGCKQLGFSLGSCGYIQLLFLSEKRQTIFSWWSQLRQTIPSLFLPDTNQKASWITCCDCMESREWTTHLFTQGMGNIMHWNVTVSILHARAKPQFWAVHTSEEANTWNKDISIWRLENESSICSCCVFGIQDHPGVSLFMVWTKCLVIPALPSCHSDCLLAISEATPNDKLFLWG